MPNQWDSQSPKSEVGGPPIPEGEAEKAEIGMRLREAVKLGGGNKAVAAKSGIPLRTLGNLLDGQEMKVGQLVRIAWACGVSMDWLAMGRLPVHPMARIDAFEAVAGRSSPAEGLDEAVLRETLEAVEAYLVANGNSLEPAKKASVAATVYSLAVEGEKEMAIAKQLIARLVHLAT